MLFNSKIWTTIYTLFYFFLVLLIIFGIIFLSIYFSFHKNTKLGKNHHFRGNTYFYKESTFICKGTTTWHIHIVHCSLCNRSLFKFQFLIFMFTREPKCLLQFLSAYDNKIYEYLMVTLKSHITNILY